MSKTNLLRLGNFNLFKNVNPDIEFSVRLGEKVQAAYSAYDKAKGYDVRGIRAQSSKGATYIRISLSLVDDAGREFFNGALFKNEKKEAEAHPDYRGSLNLDNTQDGPKLAMSAWIKTGEKAGMYLSVSITEYREREQHTADEFMDDDAPAPAPAPRPAARPAAAPAQRPAARPAPAPAPRPAARPAARPAPAPAPEMADGYDPMDDDIPF